MMSGINKDRIIDIYITNTNVENRNWKYNLSRLLNTVDNAHGDAAIFLDVASLGNLDVHNDVHLLLTEPKGVAIQNTPSYPVGEFANTLSGKGNGILGKLGSIWKTGVSLFSAINQAIEGSDATSGVWDPWMSNVQAWKGGSTQNIAELSYTFKFAMGQYGLWNAKEEVVKPILNLLAPCLPQYINSFMQYGPFPNGIGLLANLLGDAIRGNLPDSTSSSQEGSSSDSGTAEPITDDNSNFSLEELAARLETNILSSYHKYTFDIEFGSIVTYYQMLPLSARVNFSNEVDQYGYPISGNIEIKFKGIAPFVLSASTDQELGVRYGVH